VFTAGCKRLEGRGLGSPLLLLPPPLLQK